MQRLYAYLTMSRMSNLPTVWSNCLVGWSIAHGQNFPQFVWTTLALSCFYIAGMFLNDAYDAEIDARERPERPIPRGIVSVYEVFAVGYLLLAAANIAVYVISDHNTTALYYALGLSAAIVVYNYWHKNNPASPFIMASCRFFVYCVAAVVTSLTLPTQILWLAIFLASYIVGLTFAAKQENLQQFSNFWPMLFLLAPFAALFYDQSLTTIITAGTLLAWGIYCIKLLQNRQIGKAVGCMIAGISLIDAMFIATTGNIVGVGIAVGCFAVTLLAHRWIAGT